MIMTTIYIVTGVAVVLLIVAAVRRERVLVFEDGIKIKDWLYPLTIPNDTIVSISLVDRLPKLIRRTNGTGIGLILKGYFTLKNSSQEHSENATLYVRNRNASAIEIRTVKGLVYINQNTDELTQELFNEMKNTVKILENNEFSTLFIEELLENIRKSLSISQIENRIEVQKYAYNYLEGCISKIVGSDEHLLSEDEKCVMVLVGPTGIGKTTTLAKIAANIKMKEKKGVEIVTMDGYRIGAKEQIGRYAELIGIKCTYTDTCEELNKTILMSKESLVLIDTTGRSQQDGIELAKMRDFLRLKAIRPRFVLGVSATTKPKEVRNIFKNFSIFDYDQIIITKNDESETIGSILSCAIEFKKKIMFSTNGQKVPSDIEKVSKSNLIQKITGFSPEVYLENLEF
jgi:flagellar biosynthesis GTPase FlhF